MTAALALATPVARGGDFDFEALRSLVASHHIQTIEDLLPALPDTLRSHYTLVFASRSLQGASFERPRVILFGSDAQFIIAFSGDPGQPGFNLLETMEFDARSGKFLLREMEFPQRPNDQGSVAYTVPNASRCQRCHGTPARPIWDSHPLWPGAYGERYNASLSTEERTGIALFLDKQRADARYKTLLGASRFADEETFRPSARSRYSGTQQESPNATLSHLLEPLLSQSIMSELTANAAFDAHKYALLGASEGHCGRLDEFYPADRGIEIQGALRQFAGETERRNREEIVSKKLRLTASNQGAVAMAGTRVTTTLTNLRFVAENGMGVSTNNWTVAMEKGTYDFTSTLSTQGSLRDVLLAEVARHDGRIRAYSDYATSTDGDRYCNYLKRHSRAALSRNPSNSELADAAANGAREAPHAELQTDAGRPSDSKPAQAEIATLAVLKLCVDCHSSTIAPNIPFADAVQLKYALTNRPSAHGRLIDEIRYRLGAAAGSKRMPLGVNLSDLDRVALERYFDDLAAKAP